MLSRNETRKAARRAKLLANKEARYLAGKNMFTPLNGTEPVVIVKSVEPSSSPLGAEAAYGTTPLRPENQFTGKSFKGRLPEAERRQLQMVGLSPFQLEPVLNTNSLKNTVGKIARMHEIIRITGENEANTYATKNASSINTPEDENIREQLGELNASSTKSLTPEERDAAIYSYRGNILNRLQGDSFVYPQDPGPLPPGWYEAMNQRTGKPYYHAGITSTPQWNRPRLPVGWYEAKDADGSPYYYKSDGTVQWHTPLKGGRKSRNKRRSRKY
jgi:hypothetical protein